MYDKERETIPPAVASCPVGVCTRKWLFTAATVVAFLVLAIVFLPSSEPSYQGKRLSGWLDELPTTRLWAIPANIAFTISYSTRSQTESNALQAVRSLGTNSLPHLLRRVRQDDHPVIANAIAWINSQKYLRLKINSCNQRRLQAYTALSVLNDQALPVWTDVMLDEKLPLERRSIAALSLARLPARTGVPWEARDANATSGRTSDAAYDAVWHVFLLGVQCTNQWVRSNSLFQIGEMGLKAKGAVSGLLPYLADRDPAIRATCVTALGKCDPDPVASAIRSLKYGTAPRRAGAAATLGRVKEGSFRCVEALSGTIQDPIPYFRETAISALADLGPQASNAIPALLLACTDTNKFVRRAATNALSAISSGKDGG